MSEDLLGLKVNQKIQIIHDDFEFRCNIQDVKANAILIDTILVSGSRKIILHVGDKVLFNLYKDGEIIKCSSNVLGYKKEENIMLAVISYPTVIERIQRREYFRIPVAIDCKYVFLPEEADYRFPQKLIDDYADKMEKSFTIDLSGGGMKVVTKLPRPEGSLIMVSINIPEEIYFTGKVIRLEEDTELKQYKVAIKFIYLQERKRDKLINFIFNKLRELNISEK